MRNNVPTAAQTAAALRTLVASRYESNFGSLTRALLGDDQAHYRAVNAQIWRAHSETKPSHLDPELAKKILSVFPRAKNDKEKKALAVIRIASKLPPREKKTAVRKPTTKRRSGQRPTRAVVAPTAIEAKISGLVIDILSGGKTLVGFTSYYNPSQRKFEGDVQVEVGETEVVFSVRVPKETALGLFLS